VAKLTFQRRQGSRQTISITWLLSWLNVIVCECDAVVVVVAAAAADVTMTT